MPKQLDAEANWQQSLTVPDWRDPMASAMIENLARILLDNTQWLREFIEQEVQNRVSHATATSGVHGATASAEAGRVMTRDSAGRAKVAAPAADDDIARRDTVQAAMNSRAPSSHSHPIDQVSGLGDALAGKAPSSHSHSIGQVSGLQSALNGKAASSHSHSIGQVDGLSSALGGRAPVVHTHLLHQVTGLPGALASARGAVPTAPGMLGFVSINSGSEWRPTDPGWYLVDGPVRVRSRNNSSVSAEGVFPLGPGQDHLHLYNPGSASAVQVSVLALVFD